MGRRRKDDLCLRRNKEIKKKDVTGTNRKT